MHSVLKDMGKSVSPFSDLDKLLCTEKHKTEKRLLKLIS